MKIGRKKLGFSRMTSRERIMAAMRRQEVDRVPWSPFFTYWWEAQSDEMRNRGQPAYCREIGADALLRGPTTAMKSSDVLGLAEVPLGSCYNLIDELPGCTIRRTTDGVHKFVMYETPVGNLDMTITFSANGNTWFVNEHLIRKEEDYKILRYMVEHMKIVPNYEPVNKQIRELGVDGVFVPVVSPFLKTPFQSLVENFVGTQQLTYDLYDYPETVEATLAAMSEKAAEGVKVSMGCDAEVFLTWEDSSTTLMSPDMFAKYVVPDIDRWGGIIHASGKMLIHHACGHLKALVPLIKNEEIDALESISPPPTGNIEIWDVKKQMGDGITLIGGIEPVQFQSLEGSAFDVYIHELLDRMDERGFILANSDSCPPGVTKAKFKRVGEILMGRYRE